MTEATTTGQTDTAPATPTEGQGTAPATPPGQPTQPATAAQPAPESAPAVVEYDIQAPEGVTAEQVEQFKAQAKELGLSQEQAVKVFNVEVARNKAHAEVVTLAKAKWLTDAKADPEFGGDKFDASMGDAKKAIDQFTSEPLRQLLDKTGLINNPEILRMFVKVGKAISQDNRIVTGQAPAKPKSAADVLYPETK